MIWTTTFGQQCPTGPADWLWQRRLFYSSHVSLGKVNHADEALIFLKKKQDTAADEVHQDKEEITLEVALESI